MKRKNKLTFDFEKKISEFYLLLSLTFCKWEDKDTFLLSVSYKEYSVRINLFYLQLEITYYRYSK
jgi:hypothetical protein